MEIATLDAPSVDRAYSRITVRAIDPASRTFRGTATTPELDHHGDTIDPMGAKWTNPLPLLHAHRHDAPIGTVTLKPATARGIAFEARIPIVTEPGLFKDRVDLAWAEILHGATRAVSIGFKPEHYEPKAGGGLHFKAITIIEVSTVSVPANASCTIAEIKAFDDAARRASASTDVALVAPDEPSLQARRNALLPEIQAAHRGGDLGLWQELIEADEELKAEIENQHREGLRKSLGLAGLSRAHTSLEDLMERKVAALETVLERRVLALDAAWKKKFDTFQRAMLSACGEVMKAKFAEAGEHMRFCGVHQRALAYRKGSLVSDRSGAWVSIRDVAEGERPGDGDGWQLLIRTGRDAR